MTNVQTNIVMALSGHRPFSGANTVVCWEGDEFRVIYHGNLIAFGHRIKDIPYYKVDTATFAGWHTTSTCARLKAIGVDTKALWKKERSE